MLVSRFYAVIEPSSSESEDEYGLLEAKKSKFMDAEISESESEKLGKQSRRSYGITATVSESEFSDDSDSEFSEDEGEDDEHAEEQTAPIRKSRFLIDSDDEDDEAGGRVVRSQKEKAWDEIISALNLINDSIVNSDWHGANVSFDRVLKTCTKNLRFGLPKEFYEFLNGIESALTGIDAKKLEKEAAKAFNALRQKSRKALTQFAEEMARALGSGSAASGLMPSAFGAVKLDEINGPKADGASKVIELTAENVLRKLQEIVASRGKKTVDRHENLRILQKLYVLARTNEEKIHVLNVQISTEFDIAALASGFMTFMTWSSTLQNIRSMLELLLLEAKYLALDASQDPLALGLPSVAGIRGTFSSYLYRIDDEFTRALQNLDPHSSDYSDFLKMEPSLAAGLFDGFRFFSAVKAVDVECNILVRYLEHIYYKPTDVAQPLPFKDVVRAVVDRGNDRLKYKALLYHVFHLAMNMDYKAAREVFMQYRFQEILSNLDANAQILYNRVLVQMAMCAFRSGYIKDAYFSLQELCSSGRPKELLAQCSQYQRNNDKTVEQERAERSMQVPAHLFLNVELIDCIFLTCSMLLEIPQTALFAKRAHQHERRMYQSRHLRRLMDAVDRNVFNGPPENTREALVAAAKALASADWDSCCNLVLSVKVWSFVADFDAVVKPMLIKSIKEAALCTFIFSYGPSFSTLSINYLSNLFELSEQSVVDLVNRLVSDAGMNIVLKENNSYCNWKTTAELSGLQELALVLAEKIQVLMDRNDETQEFFGRPFISKN